MNISKTANFSYYSWLSQLAWSRKFLLSLLMAGAIGIFAQLRIVLPWTPVPITGQVFAVLFSGIILGNLYGGLSVTLYLLLGFAGIPWFSGGTGSLIIGPTTGYLIGFIPAALFIGWAFKHNKRFLTQLGLLMIGVIIIYFFGAGHFALFMKAGLKETMLSAVLPFIPMDIIKAIVAASIARVVFYRDD